MTAEQQKFHPLDAEALGIALPSLLNDPLDYTPHPLCRAAADEVFRHLQLHPEWSGELADGKMFGVLVVRNAAGQAGFLAAFSGNLGGSNLHPYFVPPIYDMLAPDGFFRRGETEISRINRTIAALEADEEFLRARENLERTRRQARTLVAEFRLRISEAKEERARRRKAADDPAEIERLDNESRREKSELRRLKEALNGQVTAAESRFAEFARTTADLKARRRRLSEELQRELFRHFEVVDARGCRCDLLTLFGRAVDALPPAGAGECAAPKLLQYAFDNGYEPLAVAEFWYGRSPSGEVRRHGSFYTACRGKCKPILEYMLRGVPLLRNERKTPDEPRIICDDPSFVVVDKPAGMLSVEGKVDIPSVEQWAAARYPQHPEIRPVHRLDMDVSGLLLIAKDSASYRNLQQQFLRRTVVKRYAALLEGETEAQSGTIELPLRPDPDDRPRQIADPQHGRTAITRYRVRERRDAVTRIEFEPVTGRTHQLRVHAASPDGLDAPIAGDTLYGAAPAERLFLHNEHLEFDHPQSGVRMIFDLPADF